MIDAKARAQRSPSRNTMPVIPSTTSATAPTIASAATSACSVAATTPDATNPLTTREQ